MKRSGRTSSCSPTSDLRPRARSARSTRAPTCASRASKASVEYAFGRVPIDQINAGVVHEPLASPPARVHAADEAHLRRRLSRSSGSILAAPLIALVALARETRRRACPVPADEDRRGRATVHHLQAPDHALRRRAERRDLLVQERPAVTRVGRVLRRTHLDELPQLWNVLTGRHVHRRPRPERPEFIELIEETVPFWNRRLLVKPGITGWAQVRCGYAPTARTWRRSSPTTSGTCGTAACWSTSRSA